jgi:type I restriction enzyme S subunit
MDIKPEWEAVKLGDVAKIDNGNAFKSSEYVDSGARVIRITNVQKGHIVDAQPKYMALDRMHEFRKYELFADDLLMSLTGNVGRVGLYPDSMLPGLLNQRVARVRPDEQHLDKKFLFYMLNRDDFEDAAIKSSSGIAQKNMSTEWLKGYEIPLPPIEIQREIVAELEAEQKLIDANKKLIEIYQAKTKSKIAEIWGE